jgi:hypothetical protein
MPKHTNEKETTTEIGIGSRINCASTANEIEELLLEGSKFKHVHPGTIRRWKRNTERRLTQLDHTSSVAQEILRKLITPLTTY